ncbi:MAG: hypothetical protein ABIZ05_16905 [Pseudonocardiaceae bacterium]
MEPLDVSRHYGCGPGPVSFTDRLDLAGWEERSVWGYDEPLGGFFAQLWTNASTSDEPEIWLSAGDGIYPWPGCIALEIVERTRAAPLAVVRALGVADPKPRLRPLAEITARMTEIGEPRDQTRFVAGQLLALGWTLGAGEVCPGSRLPSIPGRPSPRRVDAERHLVTGRVYRGADRDLHSGADTGLSWALGRGDELRELAVPAGTIAPTTSPEGNPGRVWLDVPYEEKDQAKTSGCPVGPRRQALVRLRTRDDWSGPLGRAARYPRSAARRGPIAGVWPFRGPGPLFLLVHQRPLLRRTQGLGTTPPDDHEPGWETLRSVRQG